MQINRKPRVYIAGPYSHGDVTANVRAAIMAADRVAEAGGAPFVPHLTHFWHMLAPHDYEFWLAQDAEWLLQCQVLLRLPGASSGAAREVALATEAGIYVFEDIRACLEHIESCSEVGSELTDGTEIALTPGLLMEYRNLLNAASKAIADGENERQEELHTLLHGAYLAMTERTLSFGQLVSGFPNDQLADNPSVKTWRAAWHDTGNAAELLRHSLRDAKRSVLKI